MPIGRTQVPMHGSTQTVNALQVVCKSERTALGVSHHLQIPTRIRSGPLLQPEIRAPTHDDLDGLAVMASGNELGGSYDAHSFFVAATADSPGHHGRHHVALLVNYKGQMNPAVDV